VTVDRAKLWTLPEVKPALIGAAVSVETAGWVAEWADGLATIAQPHAKLTQMIDAYRGAGGAGKLVLQVHLSYARTDEEALAVAHDQWRTNVFAPPVCWDLDTPEAFDEAAKHVPPAAMHDSVLISSDTGRQAAWLAELAELGFDDIYLHNVGVDQDLFIDDFGEHVLPQLTGATS